MISLRRSLLTGILIPVGLFIAMDTVLLYRNALKAVNVAYDRTLLASAKSIGDQLSLEVHDGQIEIQASVQYSALEAFQTDVLSRFAYRVSDANGKTVDGDADLPTWTGQIPSQGPYAALVAFYDDQFRGDPVRVAVLLQPIATPTDRTMATIQVAETLELREQLATNILKDTLMRQAALAAFIALITVVVVQWATRPVRALRDEIQRRPLGDLSPITVDKLPKELGPVLAATNDTLERLQQLLALQKRFVRDASHQLRTPLAVLKTQVQSALRGDVEARQALLEINGTVNRANRLANQMLALAKVSQLDSMSLQANDWSALLREVAVDLSPLIAEKNLDFDISTTPCRVQAHEWMLKELSRNLLHNAIRHSPQGAALNVRLQTQDNRAQLLIVDEGPGLSEAMRERLFQPFSAGDPNSGSGLGLSICKEIVRSLGGTIELINEAESNGSPALPPILKVAKPLHVKGLQARVELPLDFNRTSD
jgi:two-component system sensor histidine kinase TctE